MILFLDARHSEVTGPPGRPAKAAFHGGIVGVRFRPRRSADDSFDDLTRQSVERHPIDEGVAGEADRFHIRSSARRTRLAQPMV